MRAVIFAILLIGLQLSRATVDFDFDKLKQTISTNIETLSQAATTNIKNIVDTIDLEKLKKIDFLHIMPTMDEQKKLFRQINEMVKLSQDNIPIIFDPYEGKTRSYYFQKLHGLKGRDLIKALGAGLPMPILMRIGAI